MALRSFVWPKSHLAVHRYFKEHPEDIPTGGAICTSKPAGELHGIPSPRIGGNGMSESYMRRYMPGGYDGGDAEAASRAYPRSRGSRGESSGAS